MLAWRKDRLPHGMLQQKAEAVGTSFRSREWETALGQWFQDIGFTALHPGGSEEVGDSEGQGVQGGANLKKWWAPPEGVLWPEPRCLEQDFTSKMEDVLHKCHVTNKCMLHTCSGYCLKKKEGTWQCRGGFGKKDDMKEVQDNGKTVLHGKKHERITFGVTTDPRGYLVGEMPRDHPRMVQHIQEFPALWGGNCDQTVIISPSDPDDPDPRELHRAVSYCCGYMCKNKDTVGGTLELYKSVVRSNEEEKDDESCRSIMLKCMNKSVGRQEVSAPCADSFLSDLPLVRCSQTFVSLSLGTDRIIQISSSGNDPSQRPEEGARERQPATMSNARDKYIELVKNGEGSKCTTSAGESVAIERISLYEFASGPIKNKPVGSLCPVPKGGNVDVSWPLAPSYCKAMLMLHQPGMTEDATALTDQDWIMHFQQFLATEDCPTIIATEVYRAEKLHHRRVNGNEDDEEEDKDDFSGSVHS
jgi:hypothetical protein